MRYEIFTIRPDGTGTKRLTFSPGNDSHGAWSPDGEYPHGFQGRSHLTGSPRPYGEIFVTRSDGTNVEQLTDNQWEDAGPAWQPTPNASARR